MLNKNAQINPPSGPGEEYLLSLINMRGGHLGMIPELSAQAIVPLSLGVLIWN